MENSERGAEKRTGANSLQDPSCCCCCRPMYASHQRNHHNNKKTPSHFFRSFILFLFCLLLHLLVAGRLLIIRAQVWRMLISLYARQRPQPGIVPWRRISVPPQACNYIYSARGLGYWPPMKETDGPSFSVSRPDNPQAGAPRARSTASSQKVGEPRRKSNETERKGPFIVTLVSSVRAPSPLNFLGSLSESCISFRVGRGKTTSSDFSL